MRCLQWSYFDGRKTDIQNYALHEIATPLSGLLNVAFAGIHLDFATESIDIRTTKKGQISLGRKKSETTRELDLTHNRVKDLPLPEGRADRLLEVMGIATPDGQVKPTRRAKFNQVNEFLKQLSHAIADADLAALGRPIEILDCGCGCGSSYLTLAAHHYLNNILHFPARLLGVDVNDSLVRASTDRAAHLEADGVTFSQGRIGRNVTSPVHDSGFRPDIVLALHACDTATDDAIIEAVRNDAKLFLGVPCCHRHLNRQLRREGPNPMAPLLAHGILRERQADLLTDTFRATALRIAGYRTDVVEFISAEDTARNLMIRAVRSGPKHDPRDLAEFTALKAF
ncbi:MAG: methyltransferase [Gemmataceae bacterium]